MILSAAGAVDHDALVREAERLFGHIDARPAPAVIASSFSGGEHRAIKPLEQAHFALAIEGPSYRDEDIYIAQVCTTILGGGMSSRLFQEIREKRGLCYTIYAQTGAYGDTGQTTIYAGTSAEQIGELAEITMDEIKRAADDMRPDEIARARAQMKAGLLMGLESPSSRAERLARMVAIWGRVPPLSETVARIDAVTTGDVKAFAQNMTVAQSALALYGPVEAAPSLEQLRARLAA
jgi:predicted Zn-dependent peptidase